MTASLIICDHPDQMRSPRVCEHLLTDGYGEYYQRFTERGTDHDLICETCRADLRSVDAHVHTVCPPCLQRIKGRWYRAGFTGHLPTPERRTNLSFAHTTVDLRGLLLECIVALAPLDRLPGHDWVVLTANGALLRLDLLTTTVTTLAQVRMSLLAERVTLRLSPDGRFAAVANTYGCHGSVFDLETGEDTMRLCRDAGENEVSAFPVDFFVHQGRSLLIHGAEWNRLDISDPATGNLLTGRELAAPNGQGTELPHYLDYFHCGLTVSPDGTWIADNGWVWHPVGMVTTWNLRRWIDENVWESEDGPTRRDLCDQDDWDKPLCWLDGQTLVVWGYRGPDLPSIRVFDVTSGREVRSFIGPLGELVYDTYLFSFASEPGVTVWDVKTGERLLRDDTFSPVGYHHGARRFVTVRPNGLFQVSRLLGSSDNTGSTGGSSTRFGHWN